MKEKNSNKIELQREKKSKLKKKKKKRNSSKSLEQRTCTKETVEEEKRHCTDGHLIACDCWTHI